LIPPEWEGRKIGTDVDLPSFNVLSLCAGIGGLDLGLKRVIRNARTACFVEIEAFCIADLVTKMQESSLGQALFPKTKGT
jgi:site-specific DNA-cytosine methylase